jgi:hypothetical protein
MLPTNKVLVTKENNFPMAYCEDFWKKTKKKIRLMPKLQEREKVPTKLISRFNFCNIQGKDIADMDAILVCFDTFFCKKKYFTILPNFKLKKAKYWIFVSFFLNLETIF